MQTKGSMQVPNHFPFATPRCESVHMYLMLWPWTVTAHLDVLFLSHAAELMIPAVSIIVRTKHGTMC